MRKIVMACFAAAIMAFGGINPAVGSGAATDPSDVAGQILVKFRDNGAAFGVLRQNGLSDGPGIGDTGAHVIPVPAGRELQLVEALNRNPAVEYAEPDQVATASTADPYFDRQYALQNVGQSFTNTRGDIQIPTGTADADVDAVEACNVTTGSGIKVAVLDSGVDTDHPDINPKVVARANFSGAKTNEGIYGHGAHVAGIVAATHNAEGVAGVCPDCTILAAKVLNDSGVGSLSGVADGINWAVSNAWSKGAVLRQQRRQGRVFNFRSQLGRRRSARRQCVLNIPEPPVRP